MKNIPKKIAIPIIGASVILFGYFVTKDLLPYAPPPIVKPPVSTVVERKPKYETPSFIFPARYFSTDQIHGGSVNIESDTNNPYTWKELVIDEGFHSFPTTTITLNASNFSSKREEWLLKQDDEVVSKKFFDVDGDGEKETILGLCSAYGKNCPHQMIVLKDTAMIFSVYAGLIGLDLVEQETGNGFYVHWVPTGTDEKWDKGLCCPLGYVRTRFVYEDGVFKPVYEQDVWYVKVQNKTSE